MWCLGDLLKHGCSSTNRGIGAAGKGQEPTQLRSKAFMIEHSMSKNYPPRPQQAVQFRVALSEYSVSRNYRCICIRFIRILQTRSSCSGDSKCEGKTRLCCVYKGIAKPSGASLLWPGEWEHFLLKGTSDLPCPYIFLLLSLKRQGLSAVQLILFLASVTFWVTERLWIMYWDCSSFITELYWVTDIRWHGFNPEAEHEGSCPW